MTMATKRKQYETYGSSEDDNTGQKDDKSDDEGDESMQEGSNQKGHGRNMAMINIDSNEDDRRGLIERLEADVASATVCQNIIQQSFQSERYRGKC
jgi:hypothetical protein